MEFSLYIVFNKLPTGTLVKNVPLSHPVFDQVRTYIKNRKFIPRWQAQINEMIKYFQQELFDPIYYCKQNSRIEDGAHRYLVAEKLGIKTLDLKIYREPRKKVLQIEEAITRKLKEEHFKNKDFQWLYACKNKKWIHIARKINFKKKRILDVGCNTGYTILRSIQEGAIEGNGIDTRWDVVSVASQAANNLHGYNQLKALFGITDFRKWDPGAGVKYDIVFCMGVLHYFNQNEYRELLLKLVDLATEYLVIEMRLAKDGTPGSWQANVNQSLPTRRWLLNILSYEFSACKRYIISGENVGVRELWILKKGINYV